MQNNSWYEIIDPTTNLTFYANDKTGECSWRAPPGNILQGALPKWWELWDEVKVRVYYFNDETGETHWVIPKDLDVVPIPLSSYDDKMIRNALSIGFIPLENNDIIKLIEPEETKSEEKNKSDNESISPSLSQSKRNLHRSNSVPTRGKLKNSKHKKMEKTDSKKHIKDKDKEIDDSLEHKSKLQEVMNDIDPFKLEGYAQQYFAIKKK